MTNHLVRFYVSTVAILVFFVLWATVAAHPWATTEQVTPQDPRLVALAAREKRLQNRAAEVKRVVDGRWGVYERSLARRQQQNALALAGHLQQLEASQAAAVRAAQAAVAQTAQARAYAASVVAWANQQLGAAGSTTTVASTTPPPSPLAPAQTAARPAGRQSTPVTGRSASAPQAAPVAPGATAAAAVAAPAPTPAPAAAPAAAPTPTPAATPAPAAAAAATPAPAPAPAPVAAPPPVQVVTLPPVTTTQPSAKKK